MEDLSRWKTESANLIETVELKINDQLKSRNKKNAER